MVTLKYTRGGEFYVVTLSSYPWFNSGSSDDPFLQPGYELCSIHIHNAHEPESQGRLVLVEIAYERGRMTVEINEEHVNLVGLAQGLAELQAHLRSIDTRLRRFRIHGGQA
jgi:hypothetical protein